MGGNYDFTGEKCWSARGYFGSRHNGADPQNQWDFRNYVYSLNNLPDTNTMRYWIGHYQPNGSRNLNRGEWVCIEQRIKMNTPGVRDGILEGWINDVPAEFENDLFFRTIKANNIAEVWFGVYTGGKAVNDGAWNLYFDNVVVARNRIGCYDSAASGGVVPAPTNIRYTP